MPLFPSTRQTFVDSLRSEDQGTRQRAFETLVAVYWKPLYKTARLRWGKSNEDAQDLTQSFLTRVLEQDWLGSYRKDKGSFRTYLLTLFDRFSANEQKSAERVKRGGGLMQLDFDAAEAELERQPDRSSSIEEAFHHEWQRSVFALSVEEFRVDCEKTGRARRFTIFEAYDLADESARPKYDALAEQLGVPATTITNELFAARKRLRELVMEKLRELTVSDQEFRAEARALMRPDE